MVQLDPRTLFGRWLADALCGFGAQARRELPLELKLALSEGALGPDETAVASITCHLALLELERRWGPSGYLEMIDAYLPNWLVARSWPTRESAVATAEVARGEPVATVPGQSRQETWGAQFMLAYNVRVMQALRPEEVRHLVRAAEDHARELGYEPQRITWFEAQERVLRAQRRRALLALAGVAAYVVLLVLLLL